MPGKHVLLWVVLALSGLALSAGIAIAASRLSSQHIGLSSQSGATEALAPASQITSIEVNQPDTERKSKQRDKKRKKSAQSATTEVILLPGVPDSGTPPSYPAKKKQSSSRQKKNSDSNQKQNDEPSPGSKPSTTVPKEPTVTESPSSEVVTSPSNTSAPSSAPTSSPKSGSGTADGTAAPIVSDD